MVALIVVGLVGRFLKKKWIKTLLYPKPLLASAEECRLLNLLQDRQDLLQNQDK
jgi:hypothetical protein